MNDNLKALLHYTVPNAVATSVSIASAITVFQWLDLELELAQFIIAMSTVVIAARYSANYIEQKVDAYTGYGQEDAQSPLVEPMTTELVSEVA